MTTIATTQSGWKVTQYYFGKAKDWVLADEFEHKKRATSAATEITPNECFSKSNMTNYNTDFYSKEGIA